MRGVSPDEKDIDDIWLAIRSFNGWGSVGPWGNYNPSLNGVTL